MIEYLKENILAVLIVFSLIAIAVANVVRASIDVVGHNPTKEMPTEWNGDCQCVCKGF